MKVFKFGGTSVGSAERMRAVKDLIVGGEKKITVLSAMSGTTNVLVQIAEHFYLSRFHEAQALIAELDAKYRQVIAELYVSEESRKKAGHFLNYHFESMRELAKEAFSSLHERQLLARGEQISTTLVQYYLEEIGVESVLLSALDFMFIDENKEPELDKITSALTKKLAEYPDCQLFITQGFICRNANGETDNLQRGGSDYTASLVGAAVDADEVQIWTDIDGMHNNDPRVVEKTRPVAALSYDEAAELAYFGAKILHPSTVLPARIKNIPVRLLNTMRPDLPGTLISAESPAGVIKAVAAKDGIIAVKIKSARMLLAHGFLRMLFEVFEKYKKPIDMITTSEVGVSVTIDNEDNLEAIVAELATFSRVEVDKNMTIVSIVGDMISEETGYAKKIFSPLENVSLRMISFGGSKNNVSILVSTKDKVAVLKALNKALFDL